MTLSTTDLGDRNSIWRAGNIINSNRIKKLDAIRITSVFTTDTNFRSDNDDDDDNNNNNNNNNNNDDDDDDSDDDDSDDDDDDDDDTYQMALTPSLAVILVASLGLPCLSRDL